MKSAFGKNRVQYHRQPLFVLKDYHDVIFLVDTKAGENPQPTYRVWVGKDGKYASQQVAFAQLDDSRGVFVLADGTLVVENGQDAARLAMATGDVRLTSQNRDTGLKLVYGAQGPYAMLPATACVQWMVLKPDDG